LKYLTNPTALCKNIDAEQQVTGASSNSFFGEGGTMINDSLDDRTMRYIKAMIMAENRKYIPQIKLQVR